MAVVVPDDASISSLLRAGLDVAGAVSGGVADVYISTPAEQLQLDGLGYHYWVVHPNVEQYYADRLKVDVGRDPMGNYMTLDEINAAMVALHQDYPNIVSEPVSIGKSIEGRDIFAVKISDNPEQNEEGEAEILLAGAIHAREAITPMILIQAMEHLCSEYDMNIDVTDLVDNRQAWFIPVQNPDGFYYNQQISPAGGGMWRKNRRNNGDGTYGVDLNRNWGAQWGFDNIGSSPSPGNETYRGTAAFSEPETEAVRQFVNAHKFVISINYHQYGPLFLYPPGYAVFHTPDRGILHGLAERITEVNGYECGTGWEVIYATNGDSDDWLYDAGEHDKIYSATIEAGTGLDGFWPEWDRIQPIIDENIPPILTAINFAEKPARIFRPNVPAEFSAVALPGLDPLFSWEPSADQDNPALS